MEPATLIYLMAAILTSLAAAKQLGWLRRPQPGRLQPTGSDRRLMPSESDDRESKTWSDYDGLLELGEYSVPFLPVWRANEHGILPRGRDGFEVTLDPVSYHLPDEFAGHDLPDHVQDNSCCGVASYLAPPGRPFEVELRKTSYGDYVRSGEHLDDPIPSEPHMTYRTKYGQLVRDGGGALRPFNLTNICGHGLFLRTADGCAVAVRHSRESQVYPARMTFTASGVMHWTEEPDPFTAMTTTAQRELGSGVPLRDVELTSFGVDARKLFWQFCWQKRVRETAEGAAAAEHLNLRTLDWEPVKLSPSGVVAALLDDLWEPAAEASLIHLALERYGALELEQAAQDRANEWPMKTLRDEWDIRGSRVGLLPDMSTRYPRDGLERESQRYVDWVVGQIGALVKDQRVVEIGPGTGRITERLADLTRSTTCVELSGRMVDKNRLRLGEASDRVEYVNKAGQDHLGDYDVALVLLVLMHNPAPLFDSLVDALCQLADTIVTCDDVSPKKTASPTWRRPASETREAFAARGFAQQSQSEHQLFDDHLVLQVFQRSE